MLQARNLFAAGVCLTRVNWMVKPRKQLYCSMYVVDMIVDTPLTGRISVGWSSYDSLQELLERR